MTEILTVRTRRDRRRFIDYAYQRNRHDRHWVPPLRIAEGERLSPKKNPFFAHADTEMLLAVERGRVVGRVLAIDDHLHNDAHGDSVAAFGFFEARDAAAAAALLQHVEGWARNRGRALLRGPLNPSLNESAGLLIDGFDTDPMLMMPHNPPEYADYLDAAGYRKVKDLYAWLYDLGRDLEPAIVRVAARLQAKHRIVVRPLEVSEFAREIEQLRELYCGAWARNWGFVPPTPAEFRRLGSELRQIFDPRCAVCAEVDGRIVACAVAIPDINQTLGGTGGRLFPLGLFRLLRRKTIVDQVRLLLLGVLAEYRAIGLYQLLICELDRQLKGTRYRRAELSWVLEDNRDINQPVERMGARRYKTYRIYQKALA
ncbi:MAG: N-acetyltransferase [Acidobacteriota bacterium]